MKDIFDAKIRSLSKPCYNKVGFLDESHCFGCIKMARVTFKSLQSVLLSAGAILLLCIIAVLRLRNDKLRVRLCKLAWIMVSVNVPCKESNESCPITLPIDMNCTVVYKYYY